MAGNGCKIQIPEVEEF